tara:strand:- start:197 stop:355 length:159 start_codon:yes stop_codon:yes gene_type:complete
MIKCGKCKEVEGNPEDMANNISDLLLCDDCYTEVRYLVLDNLDLDNLSQLNI